MTTDIYIISGFLGAGKTTLIQKLLNEAFKNNKVVLIENDFGEISVDAALLKSGGVEVREINSGCICCSLSGDFVKALVELLSRFKPDKILIEPSGVGKLSDIIKACKDPRVQKFAEVKAGITIVDVKRCKMYLDNFGEFFEDQIQNADVILLSRTEIFPERVNDAQKLVESLNEHAAVISSPWDQFASDDILCPRQDYHIGSEFCNSVQTCACGHDHEGDCEHNHSAEEAFDTITIRTDRVFDTEDLKGRVLSMEQNARGTILRAKGIVHGKDGYINLQYLPEDIQITNCGTSGNMLCVIGRDLNRQELEVLFCGE